MKNKIRSIIIILVFLLISPGLWAGGGKENIDSLAGIYVGVIPAADCPGITVTAILNTQGQYKITYQYIDRGVEVLTFTGDFTYDAKTGIINLNSKNLPPYYKAGKNSLTQLDMEGNVITGRLAKNYILRKVEFS